MFTLKMIVLGALILSVETGILRAFGWFGWIESLGRTLAMNAAVAIMTGLIGLFGLVMLDWNGDMFINALFSPWTYVGVLVAVPLYWLVLVLVKGCVFGAFERSWRGVARGVWVAGLMTLAGTIVLVAFVFQV